MIPEAEMDIIVANPKVTAFIAASDESEVPLTDSPMELTHPSPLLALTQGDYQLRHHFPPFCV